MFDFDGTNLGLKVYSPEYFNPNFNCPPCYYSPPYCPYGYDDLCEYTYSRLRLLRRPPAHRPLQPLLADLGVARPRDTATGSLRPA